MDRLTDAGYTPEEIMDGKMLTGWIPVEEQLPGNNRAVLLCGSYGWRKVGWYERGHWWTGISHADTKDDVVAWMPLPEPYKPEEDRAINEEMTNQEVVEYFKLYLEFCQRTGISLHNKLQILALDALEKQVPMKPERCDMTTICPECGTNWNRYYAYCPGCGQHIDWGAEP